MYRSVCGSTGRLLVPEGCQGSSTRLNLLQQSPWESRVALRGAFGLGVFCCWLSFPFELAERLGEPSANPASLETGANGGFPSPPTPSRAADGERDLCFHAFLAISGVFPRLQLPGQPGEQLAGRAGSAGRSWLLPAGPRLPKYKLGRMRSSQAGAGGVAGALANWHFSKITEAGSPTREWLAQCRS